MKCSQPQLHRRSTKGQGGPASRRVHNLSLATLEASFHLRLWEAAQKFGLSVTSFKKMCRAHGIFRWPYRKVAQIKKTVEKTGKRLANITVEVLESIKKRQDANANGPRRRIPVWDKRRKRKLCGMAAPLEHNLQLYLCEHPNYEVYKGQDRAGFTPERWLRKKIMRELHVSECKELSAPVLESTLAHDSLLIAPVPSQLATFLATVGPVARPVHKCPTSSTSLGSSVTSMSVCSSADEASVVSPPVVASIQPAVITDEIYLKTLLWRAEMLPHGTQQGTVNPSGAVNKPIQRDITDLGLDAIQDRDFIKFIDSIEVDTEEGDSWTVPATGFQQSAV